MSKINQKTLLSVILLLGLCWLASACTAPGRATPVTPAKAIPSEEIAPTLAAAPTDRPSPLPPTPAPASPTPAPALTADQLKNLKYTLPTYQKTVKLVDSKYEAGAGADYLQAKLLDPIAIGDLNGDGRADAAVLLAENAGGTGTFVSLLALLNQAGQAIQSSAILVDDRPSITDLKIQDGKILLQAVIHGAHDAMCCPSFHVSETFALTKAGLLLERLASINPQGRERAIEITSPTPGEQVSGSIQLQGSVTIAPFENNLVYRIYDQQGNVLAEGPVTVNAKDLGAPGRFDAPIDISKIPTGMLVRLELLDLSAEDGSPLAMDSVELLVR
jgi:hypothetical protein